MRASSAIRLCAPAMLAFSGCAHTADLDGTSPERNAEFIPPDFVGRYDGSSFETFMGMEILADGTWRWALSVGALDARSSGTWRQDDYRIYLTTDPKPVAPEFALKGIDRAPDGPLVKVSLPSGRAIEYVDVRVECGGGVVAYDYVPEEGWSPPEGECEGPVAITMIQANYDIVSERYVLAEQGWSRGDTILIEFTPNDLGIFDLTGMSGTLVDGVLMVEGPLGSEKLRKIDQSVEEPQSDPR